MLSKHPLHPCFWELSPSFFLHDDELLDDIREQETHIAQVFQRCGTFDTTAVDFYAPNGGYRTAKPGAKATLTTHRGKTVENTAVTSPNEDPTPDGKQTAGKPAGDEPLKADDPNATADGKTDGESLETDSQEVEIVLRGDEGTPPKKLDVDAIVRRRVNRAKKQVNAVQGELSETAQKLAIMEDRNKMLQMSIDQQKAQSEIAKPPDPNDFDDGTQDAKYIAAQSEHEDKRIEAAVKKQTAHLAPQPAVNNELEQKRTTHYRRLVELNAKNFEEIEDKAIGILGQKNADMIIQNSSKSAEIFLYLGKNPDKAEELAELSNSNAWAAISMIGRLEADLQVKRTAKTNQAPNPDDELEGTTQGTTNFQEQLERERKKVMSGESNNMDAVIAIKKKALEAGVKL